MLIEAGPIEILVESISAGRNVSCGLDSQGNAYCWGDGGFGQIGNGSNQDRLVPTAVNMPPGVSFASISVGASTYVLALDTNGNAWGWGSNLSGQLGNGTTIASNVPIATSMPVGATFIDLAAGEGVHAVALDTDGNAWAWGAGRLGQLGDGSSGDGNISTVPVAVTMPPGVTFTDVSAATGSSHAVDTDGNAWGWGENVFGQLGDGTNTQRNTPVMVNMPSGISLIEISAYYLSTLALDSEGNAWGWGIGSSGQLGNNTTANATNPRATEMPVGVSFTSINVGLNHTLALDTNGNAWAWGNNTSNQLGSPSASLFQLIPIAVEMPTGLSFSAISAGQSFSLAIGTDGSVWSWGSNGDGQLGDGTRNTRFVPGQVNLPSGITF